MVGRVELQHHRSALKTVCGKECVVEEKVSKVSSLLYLLYQATIRVLFENVFAAPCENIQRRRGRGEVGIRCLSWRGGRARNAALRGRAREHRLRHTG